MFSRNEESPLILEEFRAWMLHQRGAVSPTVDRYCRDIRALFKLMGSEPGTYAAPRLREFVVDHSKSYGRGTTQKLVTSLRAFLRFCVARGLCPAGLDGAIPTVAHWRRSALPRYLPASDVERIIAACDPETDFGIRDRAMVLLLARLGLRPGDVAALHFCDLDWQDASIRLAGKGRREARLPLPQQVGDAILAYLKRSRPASPSDHVFLTGRAPWGPFASGGSVSSVVYYAMKRAEVVSPSPGAHVLRHSAATGMLRQGASLQEIAKVLRHRSTQTTEIYAKVDIQLLRTIAQPWPEAARC